MNSGSLPSFLHHGADLRPAAVDEYGLHPHVVHQHDVAHDAHLEVIVDHRVAAVFDDDGLAGIPLDIRQSLDEYIGLFTCVVHRSHLQIQKAAESRGSEDSCSDQCLEQTHHPRPRLVRARTTPRFDAPESARPVLRLSVIPFIFILLIMAIFSRFYQESRRLVKSKKFEVLEHPAPRSKARLSTTREQHLAEIYVDFIVILAFSASYHHGREELVRACRQLPGIQPGGCFCVNDRKPVGGSR